MRNMVPPEEDEDMPEPDYFSDMQPEIRKTAKVSVANIILLLFNWSSIEYIQFPCFVSQIMVRKKDNSYVNSAGLAARFAMTTDLPPPTDGELGVLDESETTWGDEALEDLSWEADSAIKEKKRLEREIRKQEQMKKKQERDAQKFRKDSGGLLASKLS